MRWKAICEPSGDQAGLIHSEGWCVKRRRVSLPMALTYRSKPFPLDAGSPFQAKAIREPSGEKAGEISSPGKAVNGKTLSAADAWRGRDHRLANPTARVQTRMARRPAAIACHVGRVCLL